MEKLKNIVSRVFNIAVSEINDELTCDNTEGWDSFNHLLLITEIEKEMGVKFSISEVREIKTFKDIRESIANKKKPL